MQFTHLAKQSPTYKPANFGNTPRWASPRETLALSPTCRAVEDRYAARQGHDDNQAEFGNNNGNMGKITTLPGKIKHSPVNAGNNSGNTGKFSKIARQDEQQSGTAQQQAHGQHRAASFQQRDGRRTFQPALRRGPIAQFVRRRRVRWRPFVRRRRLRAALDSDRELQTTQNRAEHTLCPVFV